MNIDIDIKVDTVFYVVWLFYIFCRTSVSFKTFHSPLFLFFAAQTAQSKDFFYFFFLTVVLAMVS